MKTKTKPTNDGWGFDPPDERHVFNDREYQKHLQAYNKPITKHECSKACKGQFEIKYWHEMEDIFDDFELCQRHRENAHMDIVRVQGREMKERLMLRRFVSTHDGAYVLRFDNNDMNALNRIVADIRFETEEDQIAYYNYAIKVFGFTEVDPIGKEADPWFEDDGWGFGDSEDEWDSF